jgi:serine/threonine protein kinase
MSVVYLAEHDWLQRKVALKVLSPQLAEDERFRERFVRESRLAASLDHPNVIPIYEAGASGGDLFIAMRYVEGTDLRTLLHEGGALEPGRAVAIVRQVAAALDAAHEQGLVHRDVKPGNVLLARQRGSEAGEHVYLSDFGLTKRSASDSGITGTGQFVGTLDYAAPEQFKGGTPDERTDVYSLGCVLFECLTGEPPFTSENDAGLMYAHLQAVPPSVTSERPELPRAVDGVLARAMAKAPSDRYAAAGALADEASRALGITSGVAGAAPDRSRLRRLIPVIAVAIALLAGIVLASVFRSEPERAQDASLSSPPAVASPMPPPTFRTDERPLRGDEPRLLTYIPQGISEDCRPLDRTEPIQGELASLVCRTKDVEVLYELFPTRELMDAAFQGGVNSRVAPDGECATDRLAVTPYTVAGERTGRVLCYTVRAGQSRQSSGEPSRSHIEWTDENALIYAHAIRNDLGDLSLYKWWVSSAGPVVATGVGAPAAEKDRPPALATALRDGTYMIALTEAETRPFIAGTIAIRLVDDIYQTVNNGNVVEEGRVYLQKPDTIVFAPTRCPSNGEPGALLPAAYSWTVSGDSVTFDKLRGGPCAGPQPRYAPSRPWTRAPDGLIAVEQDGEVELVDPGGSVARSLTETVTTPNKWPDWSPDGSKIVFAGTGQEGLDLYVMNADGTGLERITDAPGDEYAPAWSPAGDRIAFGFDNGAQSGWTSGLASVRSDGTGWTELFARIEERIDLPAWSPDGDRVAFTIFPSDVTQEPSPFVVDADGRNLVQLRKEPGVALAWTPRGQGVVLSANGSLVTVRPDGTDEHVFIAEPPEGGRLVIDWSADEDWIVMSSSSGFGDNLYLTPADGSETFQIGLGTEPSWRPTMTDDEGG